MSDSFPRQFARTQRLTLGEPRDVTVTADGATAIFARSRGGADPVNCLWTVDIATGREELLCDPLELLDAATDDLPPEERARRERLREGAGGITSFALDRSGGSIAFTLGGALFVCDLASRRTIRVDTPGPVFDPRLEPSGERVAYVRGAELWVTDPDGVGRAVVGEPGAPAVTWGSADFVAAEEMHRYRGFWWSPDGATLAVCRVDVAEVATWHIADPADPARPPNAVRYPAAGTTNPQVRLFLCDADAEGRVEIEWDRAAFEYLAKVEWTAGGLVLTVQSRDQRRVRSLLADPATGTTELIAEDRDDRWVELVPGTGRLTDDGRLVWCTDREGARRLAVGDEVVSPADVQVRAVVAVEGNAVTAVGNPLDDATVQHVYRWTAGDGFRPLTEEPGVHTAAVGGPTTLIRRATLAEPGGRWLLPAGSALASHAERPLVRPNVVVRPHAGSVPATAVLLPHDHDGGPLPVLLDPYGGPHAQRVVRAHNAFCASQWFADQGFAVVIVDGRGTPGRGTEFERAVHGDLADGVLEDQITGLHAAAERHPELDLGRVAIRGWSFGGYLAALAVLRRPDAFHAAIAGAPVTEWRLYDTHYTERYLGDPGLRPDVYDESSLLPLADRLTRPLLLIHGLADDNVVAAHTLQLSAALLAAGRPHEVLPLVGVTHMTPQEVVAENLLLHQLDFLRRALESPASGNLSAAGERSE